MEFMNDLGFVIGTAGIVIYLCLIVIRFTSRAGKLRAAIAARSEQRARLEERVRELEHRRDDLQPKVDALIAQVVELRGVRDHLQIQYQEMQARSRDREIHIKRAVH